MVKYWKKRITKFDVVRYRHKVIDGDLLVNDLLNEMYVCSERKAWNIAWILCDLDKDILDIDKAEFNRLYDFSVTCRNRGTNRLIYTLLYKVYIDDYFRTDLLDVCLDRFVDNKYEPALRSVCLKIAYKMCQFNGDLLKELIRTLEYMETELLPPAVSCVKRKILKVCSRYFDD